MKVSARKSSQCGARLIIIYTRCNSPETRLSLLCGDAERCFENEGEASDWGGGDGLALLNVRRLGQVAAFGPSKDERLSQMQKCCKCCV